MANKDTQSLKAQTGRAEWAGAPFMGLTMVPVILTLFILNLVSLFALPGPGGDEFSIAFSHRPRRHFQPAAVPPGLSYHGSKGFPAIIPGLCAKAAEGRIAIKTGGRRS